MTRLSFLSVSVSVLRCTAVLTAVFAGSFSFAATGNPTEAAIDPSAMQVAPGFKVELLYTVPKAEQGSWVSLAVDPKGRLTAGDQYGALYRITPPPIGSAAEAKIERLDIDFSATRVPERPRPEEGESKNSAAKNPRSRSARTACSTHSTAST